MFYRALPPPNRCNIKGTTKKEFLDNKLYKGNAFDLFEKAEDFLTFCLPVAARIENGNSSRVETPAIPYSVTREAITNALVHRDYSHPGGSMSVAVYDDRVNISNTGSLPLGVQVSELSKEHRSIQRNPLIANVFYLCGKIEKWGRGTLDMIKDCKYAGNPVPKYEEVGGGFSVTLRFKEPIRNIEEVQQLAIEKLTDREKEIIYLLQAGPLTRQEIMIKTNSKLTARSMQQQLTKLRSLAIINSRGKGKAIKWIYSF